MVDNRLEAMRWFRQAEHDLKTAYNTLGAGSFDWACFQAQQAAEKSLKSLYFLIGYRRPLSHSVYDLIIGLKSHYPINIYAKAAKMLDSVYIGTRYPNGVTGGLIPEEYYTYEDAEECIQSADLILQEVRKFILRKQI